LISTFCTIPWHALREFAKQDGIIGAMDRKATNLPAPAATPSSALRTFAPGTLLRYVVLHHTGIPPAHFDLFLEPPPPPENQPLLTWRLEAPPASWTAHTVTARQADHRPIYMTFEGEISGNRGEVSRVGSGTAKIVTQTAQSLEVELTGSLQTSLILPL
jgi:hypothetical protein